MPRKKTEQSASTLRWIPAKGLKRAYELRDAGETLGSIRWRGLFGSIAEAQYGNHRWNFKRGGFLRPRVTVREASSETDLAVLEFGWNASGVLTTSDGARYRWQRAGFWSRRFAFTDDSGLELIGFEAAFGIVRRTGNVQVHGQARKMRDFGLLVTLGWYVLMLITDDESSAGAAVI